MLELVIFVHFCADLHGVDPNVAVGAPRTPELTRFQLDQVVQNPDFSRQCGLRNDTCLHRIENFRAEYNYNFDLMHDGPEGVMAMLIKLCLKQFVITEELFTVQELNERISVFNYGSQNMKDKPNIQFTDEMLRNAHTSHSL